MVIQFDSNLASLNYTRFDAFILPFLDNNQQSNAFLSFLAGLGGGIGLTQVLQLEVDRGNVITAHRVDGGYALTQRGGANDDRVFVRLLLTGPFRFLIAEYLSYLTANKQSLTFLSRTVRLFRCQIESFKIVETTERRQAMIIHLIFRQLRTYQDEINASIVNMSLAALAGSFIMSEESLYDAKQSSGAPTLTGVLVQAMTVAAGFNSMLEYANAFAGGLLT